MKAKLIFSLLLMILCSPLFAQEETAEEATEDTALQIEEIFINRIAFVSTKDKNQEIYLMDTDGMNLVRLTENTYSDRQPAFSPDGERIAYVTNKNGNFEIYSMDISGTDVVRLTDNKANDESPSFASDGKRIVFASDRDGNFEIYLLDTETGNQERLTKNISADYHPCWSPNSDKIAFSSNRDGDFEIFVMNPDGANQIKLTHNDSMDDYPSFSPDGARIVYTSNDRLFIMNADGTGKKEVLENLKGSVFSPRWSKDGEKVIFSLLYGGRLDLWTISLEKTRPKRLTKEGLNRDPDWTMVHQKRVKETKQKEEAEE